MEVDGGAEESKGEHQVAQGEAVEEEERPDPLRDALEAAEEQAAVNEPGAIKAFREILGDERLDEEALKVKELAIYRLAKLFASRKEFKEVMGLLKGSHDFFEAVPKAKTAKIVRNIIDIVSKVPESTQLQVDLCREVVTWCNAQKRTFLRQRIESRLAALLFEQGLYQEALSLVNKLLKELKKFDDKQLLVETHLVESRLHHALRNLPKAKAASTAARTASNAIYITPLMQAELDLMSGTLHCEEADYKTASSYFLEAFEAFDHSADARAIRCLKYMLLCQILQGAASEVSAITSKHGLKYAGEHMTALLAIAQAAKGRSLEEFDAARAKHQGELASDLLIQHHIHVVYEQLLEANLLKIIEPFSCVEIEHVSKLINLPDDRVEKKLSQMILDKKILGTLDQGRGQLLVYEPSDADKAYTHGLAVMDNLDKVVSSLFRRAQGLVR